MFGLHEYLGFVIDATSLLTMFNCFLLCIETITIKTQNVDIKEVMVKKIENKNKIDRHKQQITQMI